MLAKKERDYDLTAFLKKQTSETNKNLCDISAQEHEQKAMEEHVEESEEGKPKPEGNVERLSSTQATNNRSIVYPSINYRVTDEEDEERRSRLRAAKSSSWLLTKSSTNSQKEA
jgi:hypothetical protein